MSQFDIKGRNAVLETDVIGDMLPLVCVKNFSLNPVADIKETTTAGNGIWKDFDYDRLSYVLNITGLTQIFGDDDKPTFYDLYDAMVGFLEVGFRILFIDDSGNPAIITGQVIVSNKLFDANPVKLLNSSVTLIGKGELVTHKPGETNTILFQLNEEDYAADQQLTAVDNSYKINDAVVMSTSNATSQQDLVVTFRLPKLGGEAFAADYNSPTTNGLLNGNMSPITDTGTHWAITYSFDYVAATTNKSFSITEVA
jgi:hypothetical protein